MSFAQSLSFATTSTDIQNTPHQHVMLLLKAQGGDRRGALAACLQHFHAFLALDALSSIYEVKCEGERPALLLACQMSGLAPEQEIRQRAERIATLVQISSHAANASGTIKVIVVPSETPEQALQQDLAFLHSLTDIAPVWQAPTTRLWETASSMQVTRLEEGLAVPFPRDRQNSRPAIQTRLDRVGVLGITKMLQIGASAAPHWQEVSFDLFAELPSDRSGIHMSRFSDALAEVLDDLDGQTWPHLDHLAETLAQHIRLKQHVEYAEVSVSTRFPLQRWTPVSGKLTQECYGLLAEAVASPSGTRKLLGVQVEGMVACPCAQEMVHAFAQMRLAEEGFDLETTRRVLEIAPLATHNQRGVATLLLGTDAHLDPATLVEIAEQAMSSENYGLLKRPDELYIVNKAHRQPRFAEDVVREILLGVIEQYPTLSDDAYVWINQCNKETIHKYDVEAQGWGTLGEVRAELVHGTPVAHRTTKDAWLCREEHP
jgi:GTP cyclohydrolase IV